MGDRKYLKQPLKAGPAVLVLPDKPPATACEASSNAERHINEAIREIVEEAYGAGFIPEIKGISDTRYGTVILYELETDAGFHDPIG